MKLIFWLSFGLILYVYLLYPIILWTLARVLVKNFNKSPFTPLVSIIITAFNEEKDIASKIENTLSLNYPREQMEIIVASDGSTDRTNHIVRGYENRGVKLIAFPENRGKTIAQNNAVTEAQHDIVIFMDAASYCEPNALRKLVGHFADHRIGAVAGRINFVNSNDNIVTESQGLYWKYEQMLKQCESKLGRLVGVDGPLYAVRKKLYVPLPLDIISDLITPLLVIQNGYHVVFEPGAIAHEKATVTTGDELTTRRRLVLRGLYGLFRYPALLNPLARPMLFWQIISHKILRWLVGFYFIAMIIASLFLLTDLFYYCALVGMLVFLGLASIGLQRPRNSNLIFTVPYYFTLVNWAALLGTIDFLRGKRVIAWKPVRN